MSIVIQAEQDKPTHRWGRVHPAHVPEMRLVVPMLLALMAVQFLAWVTPAMSGFHGISNYLVLHGLMETVSIVVALMVFAVGWTSRPYQMSAHTVLLACGFFAVACLDFSHTFSYTGMPDFFTPNDPEKHLSFWLSARLLAALSLLAALLWPRELKDALAKYLLFASTLGLIGVIHWVVIFHQHALPHLFIPGEGLTPLKKGVEYLCIALNLVAAALLLWRMQKRQSYDAPLLFAAVVVMAMSEFYFTLYTTMGGAYNVLGHVYKMISYLFIYRAVVINAIESPYHELKAAQSNLELAVRASNTGLWHWDILSGTVSFSASWMAQLGYGPQELPHTFNTWVDLLHPDDREGALKYASDCVSSTELNFEHEFRMRHKSGGYLWILARAEKQLDATGRALRVVGSHLDMTERKRAEERFQGAVEASPTGMLMVDSYGRIVLANKRVASLFGYGEGELLGQPLEKIIPASARAGHARLMSQYMVAPSERRMGDGREVFAQHKNGHDFRVEIGLTPIEGQDGRYVLASVEDITIRLQAEKRINELIYFDPLTNLPNRNLLNDRITHAVATAASDKHPLAVLFLDLDHFKHVNDTLGHRIGDQLLQAMAQRLAESVRECDTVARVGGDEFVIVLPDCNVEAAARAAKKLQHVLAQPYRVEDQTLIATSSIGIAMYPEDGLDFETLYQRGDTAMYRAKQDGRNDYRFFTQEMQTRSERTLLLENALHQGLQRDEFFLHYQPQLSIDGARVLGVEALLRWKHPTLGLVSPAEFIPLAEASGLIVSIGSWVLRTAAQQMSSWFDEELPPMVVAVNLSAVQFRHPNLPALISEVLQETGLAPEYLELELTESAAMDNPLKAIAVMEDLHMRGVRMSIDDFGTGYSSLSYLKRFDVYKIKIDQSFVRDLAIDEDDRAIVSAIVQMARSLGFRTIAEGVETEAQREFLRAQGCDEVQGYLCSRPLPASDVIGFVRSRLINV